MKEASQVIKRIQITEKGSALTAAQNKYLFVVDRGANKMEIKRAVEELFKVSVAGVNTMRYEGKTKRGRNWRSGQRPDWKRAVVTLKKDSKIDLA